MKKRFNGGNILTACTEAGASGIPKKELLGREKLELKSNKRRLKKSEKYMNTLKDMVSDYEYNHNHLAELVGAVYMTIERLEMYIENNVFRIKTLKGK